MSSPVVNMVSSPGPMRTEAEAEDEELPFTLPPGPYSQMKPDACYAAIIGQAILSSPQHRLTLQDIYEWITTVYPYYKRGEQTWMNSVRHALSTMAVFRKVPRQRQEGKSLWAIFDCDVACFANGDFKKSLCADMVKAKPELSKTGPKKRVSTEQTSGGRATKRRRKDRDELTGQTRPPMFSAPILPPFYSANIVPGTHHQPYYQQQPTFMPQPVPAEVIFPPLPPSSSFHNVRAASSQPVSRAPSAASVASNSSMATPSSPSWSTAPPPSSDSSVPDLTLDDGSSSSPQLSQQTVASEPSQEDYSQDVEDRPRSRKSNSPAIVDPEIEFERWLATDSDFPLLNTPLSGRKMLPRSASDSAGKAMRQLLVRNINTCTNVACILTAFALTRTSSTSLTRPHSTGNRLRNRRNSPRGHPQCPRPRNHFTVFQRRLLLLHLDLVHHRVRVVVPSCNYHHSAHLYLTAVYT